MIGIGAMTLLIFGGVVGGTVALGLVAGPAADGPRYEAPIERTYDSHGHLDYELGRPGSQHEQEVKHIADLSAERNLGEVPPPEVLAERARVMECLKTTTPADGPCD